jgi:hypothetical protein
MRKIFPALLLQLALMLCSQHVFAAQIRFPPFFFDQLKLSPEEFSVIDGYYKKFELIKGSRLRLLGEIKARSIGKYTGICGNDNAKWDEFKEKLLTTSTFDSSIDKVINETNAQESMMAYATVIFRETIKSSDVRHYLDKLDVNELTKSMFFTYITFSWYRHNIELEFDALTDEFLKRQCLGDKKK